MAKRPRKLTAKQEKYKNNRISGMIVMDSYRDAYPNQKMSNKAISIAANRLEKDARISLAIEEARQRSEDNAIMGRDEALKLLTNSARVKITDVCNFRNVQVGENEGEPVWQTVWTIKDSEDMEPHIAACIKSVTVTKDGPKIELHDQHDSVKQIRGMQGWDEPKKSELSGPNGGPLEINDSPTLSAEEAAKLLVGMMQKN